MKLLPELIYKPGLRHFYSLLYWKFLALSYKRLVPNEFQVWCYECKKTKASKAANVISKNIDSIFFLSTTFLESTF